MTTETAADSPINPATCMAALGDVNSGAHMIAWFRRLFTGPQCEKCSRPAVGFGMQVRPRPAPPGPDGKPRTSLMTIGRPVSLCREHLKDYQEDPGEYASWTGAGCGSGLHR